MSFRNHSRNHSATAPGITPHPFHVGREGKGRGREGKGCRDLVCGSRWSISESEVTVTYGRAIGFGMGQNR